MNVRCDGVRCGLGGHAHSLGLGRRSVRGRGRVHFAHLNHDYSNHMEPSTTVSGRGARQRWSRSPKTVVAR